MKLHVKLTGLFVWRGAITVLRVHVSKLFKTHCSTAGLPKCCSHQPIRSTQERVRHASWERASSLCFPSSARWHWYSYKELMFWSEHWERALLVMFLMHMDREHWTLNARWDAGDTDSSPQAPLLRQTLLPDCLLSCCSGRQHPRQVAWGVRSHGSVSSPATMHLALLSQHSASLVEGSAGGKHWLSQEKHPASLALC